MLSVMPMASASSLDVILSFHFYSLDTPSINLMQWLRMWQCMLMYVVAGSLQESPPSAGFLALAYHKPVTAVPVFRSDV